MSELPDQPQHEPVSTLADAVHALPDQLIPHAPSTGGWPARRFTGVRYWEPGLGGNAPGDQSALANQIVLGVGLHPARPGFAMALDAIRSAGAAALVVRAPDTGESVFPAIDVAIFQLPERADWAHVANTLRAVCAPQSRELVATVAIGDLFALANTLATLAGAAVSIVDAGGQVVGYSTHADQPIDDVRRQTTLALRETRPLSLDADYRAVLGARSAVHLPSEHAGQFGRVARAVRSAGELLGTVWVVQTEDGPTGETRRLLDATEPLVAQHLLQARNDGAERDRRTADLLHALFDDTGPARRAAAELLLPPDGTHTVICTGYPVATAGQPVRHLHRLVALVNTAAPAHFSRSHSAVVGHHVATLVTESDPARISRFADHLVARDAAVAVGIGRPTTTSRIAQSHRDAAAALGTVLAPLSSLRPAGIQRRIAAFEQVREQLGLMRVAAVLDDLEVIDNDTAARVLAHDAANGSELAATLLVYLDTQHSVRATAEAMHVHQNTIRYRLAALRDQLGIDLDDPAGRLWLWLRLSTTPGPPGRDTATVH